MNNPLYNIPYAPCNCSAAEQRFSLQNQVPQWGQPLPIPGQWSPAPWGQPLGQPWGQPWGPVVPIPLPFFPPGGGHHGGGHHDGGHHGGEHHDGSHHDGGHHDGGHHGGGHHDGQMYGLVHPYLEIETPIVAREEDEWLALGFVQQPDEQLQDEQSFIEEDRNPGPPHGHGGGGHHGPGHGGGGHHGPGHGGGGPHGPGHGGGGPHGPHGPFGPWFPGPWFPGGGFFPIPIPIPIGGGGGTVIPSPPPSQVVYVSINGGNAYPNATATYQVSYQPGLTIYEALASTGVIQLSPSGQILVVSGVVIGGNVNYTVSLNGRIIPASMMNYNLQPNDVVSIQLVY